MKDTYHFTSEFAYDALKRCLNRHLTRFGAVLVCLESVVLYSSTLCLACVAVYGSILGWLV